MIFDKIAKCGIRVINEPKRKGVKTITMRVIIKVGLDKETDEENGISHFLEHMAFAGTTTKTEKQISEKIDLIGASSNASTGRVYTEYNVVCLVKHAKQCLSMLADIVQNPTFEDDKIERERSIILEEKHENDSQIDWKVSKIWSKFVYGDSSLGREVIGTEENIKRISKDDLRSFHAKHYLAQNMAVHVLGNVNEDDLLNWVDELFSGIKQGSTESMPSILTFGVTKTVIDTSLENSMCHMTFPILLEKTTKSSIMESLLLGYMSSSLIFSPLLKYLRTQKGLVYSAGMCLDDCLKHPACGEIIFQCKQENVEPAIKTVNEIIQEILTKKCDSQAFGMAKNKLLLILNESYISYKDFRSGLPLMTTEEYGKIASKITKTEFQKFAIDLFSRWDEHSVLIVSKD
jgi:predicted Zn-dependent peptidase